MGAAAVTATQNGDGDDHVAVGTEGHLGLDFAILRRHEIACIVEHIRHHEPMSCVAFRFKI